MNLHAAALAGVPGSDESTPGFASDAIAGLTRHPKQLPPKYFYDVNGSELFEQITRLARILSDPHRTRHPARPVR